MTKKTLYAAQSQAELGPTFDQTLARLTDRTDLAEAEMAELALDALFGERNGEGGKAATSDALSVELTDASPESDRHKLESPTHKLPEPTPTTPLETAANDDRVRDASPAKGPRAKRQLAVRLTILVVALASMAVGAGLLQLHLDRDVVFVRLGLVLASAIAMVALCAFLQAIASLLLELHERETVQWRTLAERVARLDESLQARADAERLRANVTGADVGNIRDRLDRIASSYGPAANRSAEIEAFSARIAALDHRVSIGIEATRADLSLVQAEFKGILGNGFQQHGPASRPVIRERELPFDLFCDGILALVGDNVAGDPLRRWALDAVRTRLDTMFDGERLLAAWERYRQEGAADFVVVYREHGLETMERVRKRLAADPEFSTSIGFHLTRYESLIVAASQKEQVSDLMALLSNAGGRCYTLLAHAAGRIHSTDGASGGGGAARAASREDVLPLAMDAR